MLGMRDVRVLRCMGQGLYGMWYVLEVGSWECAMLGMCDVRDVGYLGCSGCGILRMWDVGCGKFAGMWDVDLQNAGKMA